MKKILTAIMLLVSSAAFANSGGGEGGGAGGLLKLDTMVINLSEGHFIQFTPQLKLADPTKADLVKAHTPLLRHTLIMALIGKDSNVVQTAAFMASFSEVAVSAMNKAMHSEDIKLLLFDGWLIQ